MKTKTAIATVCLMLSGCMSESTYSSPEDVGLVGVRPFPSENDVCQVIGESKATINYLDHTTTLIGCPVNETGAIADRLGEGAEKLDQVGSWVLLSIPNS
jgi:hypothetical protein